MWFSSEERLISTSIAAQSNYLGLVVSYLFSTVYFADMTQNEINDGIEVMNLIYAVYNGVVFVLSLFTLTKSPVMESQNL